MCVIVMVAVPGGTPGTLLVIGPVHVPLKENGGGVGVGAVGDELPPPHAAVIHSAKTAMLRWIRILEVIHRRGVDTLVGPRAVYLAGVSISWSVLDRSRRNPAD